ncbi:MAG: ATP-binding cassette domain-containing protein, partial [Bacilli bacterium]|nr:ATP-binding cassette domain-containing protein [Bacilli bacterium]
MLKLKNVSKFYYSKGVIASGFNKVNIEFKLGEFVAIIGESGSGKSTLLNVISGLDSYEEGEMYINGEETSHYRESDFEEYRKKYVSNIFQNFNLVNSYTVYQNIELVMLLNGYKRKEV